MTEDTPKPQTDYASTFQAHTAVLNELPTASQDELEKAHHGTQAQRVPEALWMEASRVVAQTMRRLCNDGTLPTVDYDDMDAHQDALIAAIKAVPRWKPEKGPLAGWLYPRIRGALLDYAATQDNLGIGSKHASVTRVSLDDPSDIEDYAQGLPTEALEALQAIPLGETLSYEDDLAYRPERLAIGRAVRRGLHSLSDWDRRVLFGFYLEGRTINELARKHRAHGEAVRRSLRRSKKILSIFVT